MNIYMFIYKYIKTCYFYNNHIYIILYYIIVLLQEYVKAPIETRNHAIKDGVLVAIASIAKVYIYIIEYI